MDINKFIDSIENELFNRIRNSKSDAEARRLLKEHQALQLLQPDISSSSDSFDIEKSATVISVANHIFGGKS